MSARDWFRRTICFHSWKLAHTNSDCTLEVRADLRTLVHINFYECKKCKKRSATSSDASLYSTHTYAKTLKERWIKAGVLPDDGSGPKPRRRDEYLKAPRRT